MSSDEPVMPVAPVYRPRPVTIVCSRMRGWIWRSPLTVTVIAALLVVHLWSGGLPGSRAGSLASNWGYQSADFPNGSWWNLLTTLFLSTNTASLVLSVLVVGTVLGLAESTIGSWRTALAFSATQVAAVALYTALFGVGNFANVRWPDGLDQATLLGPCAASVGTLMAASQQISVLWRRRVRVLTLALAIMLSVYVGHAQHVLILIAALVGLLLGIVFIAPAGTVPGGRMPGGRMPAGRMRVGTVGPRGVGGRATTREVRNNLAMVVAVFAVGPLAAAAVHTAVGPLAVMRAWITNADVVPAVGGAQCSVADTVCQEMVNNSVLMHTGEHLLALMPIVFLLVCAEGLRRGNRLALWVTVYVHLVISVASALYFQVFSGLGLPMLRGHRRFTISESVWDLLPVVLTPALIAGALLLLRRHFPIDPDPVLRQRSLTSLPLILGVFVGCYSVAWVLEGNARNASGFVALLGGIPRIVLPYPFPFGYARSVYPAGFFSELLFSFAGPVLWLVSAMSILALFLSRRPPSGVGDAARAQALVKQGGDSLSWMTMWANNAYKFSPAGDAAVAYQIHNGVAVTVGGPVGDACGYPAAVEHFLTHCAEESLTPCFYSVNAETAQLLGQRGFRRMQVAVETLLDVRTIDFKGKSWQNVRTALNRAAKLGVKAVWCSYSSLSSSQRTQVHEISEDWVCGQSLPELGFTLGGLTELQDAHVQLCLAMDGTGKIHAVTSWLPVFHDGETVSWTLDFMRRNSGAFNGVMEYLIAQAVQHFAQSVDYISLSASPLTTDGSQENYVGRILGMLSRTLEPLYGFSSLANFKQRFQPRHRPLYLMYQDPLSLPLIGRAIAEAYLPNLSVRSMARVLRK